MVAVGVHGAPGAAWIVDGLETAPNVAARAIKAPATIEKNLFIFCSDSLNLCSRGVRRTGDVPFPCSFDSSRWFTYMFFLYGCVIVRYSSLRDPSFWGTEGDRSDAKYIIKWLKVKTMGYS